MPVLAIDAGTTGVTALVVDEDAAVRGRGYAEFEQYFPRPGWVEHQPEQIWQACLEACRGGGGRSGRGRDDHRDRDHRPAGDRGLLGPGEPAPPARRSSGRTAARPRSAAGCATPVTRTGSAS